MPLVIRHHRDTTGRPRRRARPVKRPEGLDAALAELGRRLRAAREAAGMTQEDVADDIGCHRVYVSHVEFGKRNLTVGVLLALAVAVDVDPAALVAGLDGFYEE